MSDDQIKELKAFFSEQLTEQGGRFDKRFIEHEERINKRLLASEKVIHDEMHQGFEQFNDLHEELKEEMRTGFDKIAARLDDDDIERAALESQTARHEGWINQLAERTGTDLAVEA